LKNCGNKKINAVSKEISILWREKIYELQIEFKTYLVGCRLFVVNFVGFDVVRLRIAKSEIRDSRAEFADVSAFVAVQYFCRSGRCGSGLLSRNAPDIERGNLSRHDIFVGFRRGAMVLDNAFLVADRADYAIAFIDRRKYSVEKFIFGNSEV